MLQDALEQFENIVAGYETSVTVNEWNNLTDTLEVVRSKVRQSYLILDQTEVLPARKRQTSDPSIYTEIVLPKDFFEKTPLSSTLVENEEKALEESFCHNENFEEQLNNIKSAFLENSLHFERRLNKSHNKMAFSQITAIQCIPEFDGKAESLIPFIAQVDFFAEQLEENEDHRALLNVVRMKLRGEALLSLPHITENTWDEVKAKLEQLFRPKKDIASIMKEIEVLWQKKDEPFDKYKDRAHELYKWVENEGQYALTHLRKHFLAGLRNKGLAQAGKSQREKTFPELTQWLQKECKEGEELREINSRVESVYSKEENKTRETPHQNKNPVNKKFSYQNFNKRRFYPNNNNLSTYAHYQNFAPPEYNNIPIRGIHNIPNGNFQERYPYTGRNYNTPQIMWIPQEQQANQRGRDYNSIPRGREYKPPQTRSPQKQNKNFKTEQSSPQKEQTSRPQTPQNQLVRYIPRKN